MHAGANQNRSEEVHPYLTGIGTRGGVTEHA
jgi:hypothetical protein